MVFIGLDLIKLFHEIVSLAQGRIGVALRLRDRFFGRQLSLLGLGQSVVDTLFTIVEGLYQRTPRDLRQDNQSDDEDDDRPDHQPWVEFQELLGHDLPTSGR